MMILSLLSSAALATTLEVQTSTAVDVLLDGLSIARAFGPTTITVPDVAPGSHELVLYRSGKPHRMNIEVPEEGLLRLYISSEDVTLSEPTLLSAPDGGPPPQVTFQSIDRAEFLIRLDDGVGRPLGASAPLKITDLPPGQHRLEICSPDQQVVWVRGWLTLQGGDDLVIKVPRGRMIEVFGRPEAWRPEQ